MSRKVLILSLSVALLSGTALGWVLRGEPKEGGTEAAQPSAERLSATPRHALLRAEAPALSKSRDLPGSVPIIVEDEEAYMYPKTDADRAEIRRLVRAALEDQPGFPARMTAVCDLTALMTKENSAEIKAAFEESWKAGFTHNWERAIFLSRYGEVMGQEAAEEYFDKSRDFSRIVKAWSQSDPHAVVDWVNSIPDSPQRDEGVDSILVGVGPNDTDYALEMWKALGPELRRQKHGAVIFAHRQAGGIDAMTKFAMDLLPSEEPDLKSLGEDALRQSFDALRKRGESEALSVWLEGLDPEYLKLLPQEQLPETTVEK